MDALRLVIAAALITSCAVDDDIDDEQVRIKAHTVLNEAWRQAWAMRHHPGGW